MAQLFEVKIIGTYQSQQVVNRLTFSSDIDDAIVATAFNLWLALGVDPADTGALAEDGWLEAFYAAQTTQYETNEFLVRNLYSVTDFYSTVVSGVNFAGDKTTGTGGMASFNAQKLRTNIVRTDIGRGFLSLTPPLETEVDNTGLLISPATTQLALVASRLSEITRTIGGTTATFRPAILQKEQYTPDPEKPERVAYRYYADKAEQLEHTATPVVWSAVPRISTQNSRKVGKGN